MYHSLLEVTTDLYIYNLLNQTKKHYNSLVRNHVFINISSASSKERLNFWAFDKLR